MAEGKDGVGAKGWVVLLSSERPRQSPTPDAHGRACNHIHDVVKSAVDGPRRKQPGQNEQASADTAMPAPKRAGLRDRHRHMRGRKRSSPRRCGREKSERERSKESRED